MKNSGHFVISLTTSTPVKLSSAILEDPVAATQPITWLSIQALGANAALAYVGFAGDILSTTNYMARIEIPASTIPSAPLIIETQITSLEQIQVLGTTNDKLAIGYIRS